MAQPKGKAKTPPKPKKSTAKPQAGKGKQQGMKTGTNKPAPAKGDPERVTTKVEQVATSGDTSGPELKGQAKGAYSPEIQTKNNATNLYRGELPPIVIGGNTYRSYSSNPIRSHKVQAVAEVKSFDCLLYTSPSPRD